MKKMLALIFVIILAGAAFYAATPFFLEKVSRKVIRLVERSMHSPQAGVVKAEFKNVTFEGANILSWNDVRVVFQSFGSRKNLAFLGGSWKFQRIEIGFEKAFPFKAVLKMRGVRFSPDMERLQLSGKEINNENWFFSVEIPQGLLSLLKELFRPDRKTLAKEFLEAGVMPFPIKLFGDITYTVEGKKKRLKAEITQNGEGHIFEADPDDLKGFVETIVGELVSNEEIVVMESYPLRAFRVLKIKNDVRKKALAYKKNPLVSDAFIRHLLFSYRLTKAFGPEFAEKVTEARAKDNHDSIVMQMTDRETEKIGRRYAVKGFSEDAMLKEQLEELSPLPPAQNPGQPSKPS